MPVDHKHTFGCIEQRSRLGVCVGPSPGWLNNNVSGLMWWGLSWERCKFAPSAVLHQEKSPPKPPSTLSSAFQVHFFQLPSTLVSFASFPLFISSSQALWWNSLQSFPSDSCTFVFQCMLIKTQRTSKLSNSHFKSSPTILSIQLVFNHSGSSCLEFFFCFLTSIYCCQLEQCLFPRKCWRLFLTVVWNEAYCIGWHLAWADMPNINSA